MTFRVPTRGARAPSASFWTPGEGLAWVAGVIFTLSTFMGWYSGQIEGLRLSALAWHTGIVGKLVLVVGVAVLAFLALRAAGFELPPTIPVGLVIVALGFVATVLVLWGLIAVPDDYADFGRAIGIWVSLAGALLLIVAGLLKASEEL